MCRFKSKGNLKHSFTKVTKTHLVAARNHRLLREEHLLWGNLDTQITACHHYAVRGCDDLVQVHHALVVLDLRDDEDLLAGIACATNGTSFRRDDGRVDQ